MISFYAVSDLKFVLNMKSDISVAVLLLKLFSNLDIVFSLIHRDYIVHEGKNVTIPCASDDEENPSIWTREGRNITSNYNVIIDDSFLTLLFVTSDDAGVYTCSIIKNTTESQSYQEHIHAHVRVRTRPGAVGSFRARATTIIAVLIWEVWRNRTGGSPIIDFTAEMRRLPGFYPNDTEELVEWERLDPHHITPNARYLEVYHLKPNTSYQFRIWATNEVGPGDMCTITAKTVEPTQEKDLILRILEDAKNFDTRIWVAAVAIVMGTLLILTCGTCLVLYKECQEYSGKPKLCLILNALAFLLIFCIVFNI